MRDPNKTIIEPLEHRLEGDLKICDPDTVEQTHPIEDWRIDRMKSELDMGFAFLRKYKLAATVYGSSRTEPDDPSYQAAEALSGKLSRSGFAIITGGAGGIMEAANKGAYEAKGESVGLNIKLPHEQFANKYLTAEAHFNYFFTRKVMLSYAAEVYVFFPGGYGTLNEFFEILTLVQTKKVKRLPIVLYGKSYWRPVLAILKNCLSEKHRFIDRGDLDLYTLVDSVDEAYEQITKLVKC